MRVRITFLSGQQKVAEVDAVREIDRDNLTVEDMENIVPAEQLLEKLTGLRVHIEQVHASGKTGSDQ